MKEEEGTRYIFIGGIINEQPGLFIRLEYRMLQNIISSITQQARLTPIPDDIKRLDM